MTSLLVADVGTIINPLAHQGQIEGGLMFGIGAALMEELFVRDGQITTAEPGEYKLPCPMDTPFRTVLLRDPSGPGPLGARAAGELTNTKRRPSGGEHRGRLWRTGHATCHSPQSECWPPSSQVAGSRPHDSVDSRTTARSRLVVTLTDEPSSD